MTAELLQSFSRLQPVDSASGKKAQRVKKKKKTHHILTTLWGLLVKDRHTQISATYLVWERSPDGLVKGGAEELTAVFTEADTCDSFTVSSFKPPQTLTALDLPHLNTHTHTEQSLK